MREGDEYHTAKKMREGDEYHTAKKMREGNCGNVLNPHKSLYLHQKKIHNKLLEEKEEEIKKLKKYIRDANI
jgi:hypothetical protein